MFVRYPYENYPRSAWPEQWGEQWPVRYPEHHPEEKRLVRVLNRFMYDTVTVETVDGRRFGVNLPVDFQSFWIYPGDFIIVKTSSKRGVLKAEALRVLTPKDVQKYEKKGRIPEKFLLKNKEMRKKKELEKQQEREREQEQEFEQEQDILEEYQYRTVNDGD